MLSNDLSRWFDEELWRVAEGSAGNRFATAITPQQLLIPAPAAIWPALMPCDLLPLLGNNMGDWLCVRMATDNTARQVVHWYHGGGDWIPWGNSLAEAIFFDRVRHRLPGSEREHAISADVSGDKNNEVCRQLDQWAIDCLNEASGNHLDDLTGDALAESMLDAQISQPAVLCQLVIDALDNPILTPELVSSWTVDDADQIQRSLFDNRLLSDAWLGSAVSNQMSGEQVLQQQDWRAAQSHCRRVTEVAPDLAWGWDVLGYSYERSGDHDAATECYRQGMACSIFTDQTVRVRTHGFNGDGQKFSAARLIQNGYSPSESIEKAYLDCLAVPAADERRDRVREHFFKLAESANAAEAHELWFRAGWDLGAEPMLAFAELLEQVAKAAESAGRSAQSELAKTHRNCFRDRYGI